MTSFLKDLAGEFPYFFLLSTDLICRTKPTISWSYLVFHVYSEPYSLYVFPQCHRPLLLDNVQKLLKTHAWATPLHCVRCLQLQKTNYHVFAFQRVVMYGIHQCGCTRMCFLLPSLSSLLYYSIAFWFCAKVVWEVNVVQSQEVIYNTTS